jgi:hypothetical protein
MDGRKNDSRPDEDGYENGERWSSGTALVEQARVIVAVPADTHCGSPVGLCPSTGWPLLNGGYYTPNRLQHILYQQWEECWRRVRVLRDQQAGTRLVVVHAGDAVEGVHHQTTQLISNRSDEHAYLHVACMQHALDIAAFDARHGDRLIYVGGTIAHVGDGYTYEEILARLLGACPPPGNESGGRVVWEHLLARANGVLFDIAHHGPAPGARQWLQGNNLRLQLRSIYLQCLEQDRPLPRYWVRAHRHRWIMPELFRGERGDIEGFLTPCFQAMTHHGERVAGHEVLSHIGMLIFVVEANGKSSWTCPRIKVQQDEMVDL